MTKVTRWIPLLLATELAAACNSSPDFCTHAVDVGQKVLNEGLACIDGGASADLSDAGQVAFEIDRCRDQIVSCNAQDLNTLTTSINCLDELPLLNCQWVTDFETKLQVDPDALVWIADLEDCKPAATSSTCNVTLPFDGGLPSL
jgi:hypothetical protein